VVQVCGALELAVKWNERAMGASSAADSELRRECEWRALEAQLWLESQLSLFVVPLCVASRGEAGTPIISCELIRRLTHAGDELQIGGSGSAADGLRARLTARLIGALGGQILQGVDLQAWSLARVVAMLQGVYLGHSVGR
jgi:hypothetical protein